MKIYLLPVVGLRGPSELGDPRDERASAPSDPNPPNGRGGAIPNEWGPNREYGLGIAPRGTYGGIPAAAKAD